MEERFECFTLGRDVPPQRVKEIYRLFRKHGFQIAPLRTFGRLLTDELVAEKRTRAPTNCCAIRGLLERVKAEAAAKIAKIPPRAKGVVGRHVAEALSRTRAFPGEARFADVRTCAAHASRRRTTDETPDLGLDRLCAAGRVCADSRRRRADQGLRCDALPRHVVRGGPARSSLRARPVAGHGDVYGSRRRRHRRPQSRLRRGQGFVERGAGAREVRRSAATSGS